MAFQKQETRHRGNGDGYENNPPNGLDSPNNSAVTSATSTELASPPHFIQGTELLPVLLSNGRRQA